MARTILLIDDDHLVRTMVPPTLVERGFRVLAAPNGREGIAIAARERPDLVLLDLAMSGMDGWETVRILRDQHATASIPVAAYTSEHCGAAELAALHTFGFTAHIPKSLTTRELTSVIGKILGDADDPVLLSKEPVA
jgi:CheY-like chemotaxis protein